MCFCVCGSKFGCHAACVVSPDPRFAIARAMDELDQAAKDFAVVGAAGSKDGDSPGASGGMSLLAELEGRRIRVTGEFDHSREVLVGERDLLSIAVPF